MSRNVKFTDRYLYFITKKLHRLIQIDLHSIFEKIRNGDDCPQDNEEGKTLALAIIDFVVDEESSVWALHEDSTIEKIASQTPLCKIDLLSIQNSK